MCGAVSIQYDPALKEELIKFLSEDEIRKFELHSEIVFAYLPPHLRIGVGVKDKRPLLPVRQGNTIIILPRSLPTSAGRCLPACLGQLG